MFAFQLNGPLNISLFRVSVIETDQEQSQKCYKSTLVAALWKKKMPGSGPKTLNICEVRRKILNGWGEDNIIISTRWFWLNNLQVPEKVIFVQSRYKVSGNSFYYAFNLDFQCPLFYFYKLTHYLQRQPFDNEVTQYFL